MNNIENQQITPELIERLHRLVKLEIQRRKQKRSIEEFLTNRKGFSGNVFIRQKRQSAA